MREKKLFVMTYATLAIVLLIAIVTLSSKLIVGNTCTVSFLLGDSVEVDNIEDFSTREVKYGSPLWDMPTSPTAYGYKFVGWYYAGTDTPFDRNTPIEEDVTVEARWKKLYWISFNTNGGEKMEPYQVEEGTVISEPEIPYHAGHYFTGWYSLVDEFTLEKHDFSKPVTSNVKLEAKWVVRDGNLIYDDQTLVKIILPDNYRFSDGQHITKLKNALDEHLIYDSEVVSASEHQLVAKYREIVVGRSDREISVKAYEKLEQIRKWSDRHLRYIVYVDTVEIARNVYERSVCIAYDEDAEGIAMKAAIEAFITSFVKGEDRSQLLLSLGIRLRKQIDPSSYVSQSAYTSEYAVMEFAKREEI